MIRLRVFEGEPCLIWLSIDPGIANDETQMSRISTTGMLPFRDKMSINIDT